MTASHQLQLRGCFVHHMTDENVQETHRNALVCSGTRCSGGGVGELKLMGIVNESSHPPQCLSGWTGAAQQTRIIHYSHTTPQTESTVHFPIIPTAYLQSDTPFYFPFILYIPVFVIPMNLSVVAPTHLISYSPSSIDLYIITQHSQ